MKKRHILLTTAAAVLFAAISIALTSCGSSVKASPKLVNDVGAEAAKILKTNKLDSQKPLGAQGADDLDIVEIIMAVEEAFKVEIPDSAIGKKPEEISKTLSIQKLADIVAAQTEKKK